ncbi:hypothetical protein HWV62_12100 [Athelia sp. TMB]|nr:hypothetical protein HWV62_12100 [Athelia sp. TMB]
MSPRRRTPHRASPAPGAQTASPSIPPLVFDQAAPTGSPARRNQRESARPTARQRRPPSPPPSPSPPPTPSPSPSPPPLRVPAVAPPPGRTLTSLLEWYEGLGEEEGHTYGGA